QFGVPFVAVAPTRLGTVHSRIGSGNQGFEVVSVLWIEADAYAYRHQKLVAANFYRRAAKLYQTFGQSTRAFAALYVVHQHHKFTAALPEQGVAHTQAC